MNSKTHPMQTSADEKKKQLFLAQKRTLDTFLSNGAITQAQYNKSYGDLVVLMNMQDVALEIESANGKYAE